MILIQKKSINVAADSLYVMDHRTYQKCSRMIQLIGALLFALLWCEVSIDFTSDLDKC